MHPERRQRHSRVSPSGRQRHRFAEQNQGVKFYMKNLGLRRMPQKNQILKNFELGLSFASQFSAHKTVEGGEKHE